jgi:hypothetical protein
MNGLTNGMERCGGATIGGALAHNPDGSTDYGFYRRRASRLRRETLRRSFGQAARLIRPLIAVAIVVVAIRVMPTEGPRTMPAGADVANAEVSASRMN